MSIYTLPEITRFMKRLSQFSNAPKATAKPKGKWRLPGTEGRAKAKAVLKRRRRNRISRLARRVNR